MSREENKALVRRFIDEVLNTGKADAADLLLAPDFVGHFPGLPLIQGVEAAKQVSSTYFSAFPDLHVTVEDLLAEGDKVMGYFTSRATHQGMLMGLPATHKQVVWQGMALYRIAADKIAEEWHLDDMLGLLQQLGAIASLR